MNGYYYLRTGTITAGLISLPAFLNKTNYRNPTDGNNSAFQLGFQTDLNFFSFLGANPHWVPLFNNHMSAYNQGHPSWMDVGFYPVSTLIEGAKHGDDDVLIVDIGGNRGHDLLEFKCKWPDAPGKLVLQDLPPMIEQAKTMDLPSSIEPMAHDFFTEQPIKGECSPGEGGAGGCWLDITLTY